MAQQTETDRLEEDDPPKTLEDDDKPDDEAEDLLPVTKSQKQQFWTLRQILGLIADRIGFLPDDVDVTVIRKEESIAGIKLAWEEEEPLEALGSRTKHLPQRPAQPTIPSSPQQPPSSPPSTQQPSTIPPSSEDKPRKRRVSLDLTMALQGEAEIKPFPYDYEGHSIKVEQAPTTGLDVSYHCLVWSHDQAMSEAKATEPMMSKVEALRAGQKMVHMMMTQ